MRTGPGLLIAGLFVVHAPALADEEDAPDYMLADLPGEALVYETNRFRIKPVIAIVTDYTFFDQDEPSLAQVGLQEDTFDLRAGRVGFISRSTRGYPWELLFILDYQEPRTREKEAFRLFDLRLRLPVGPVKFDIGKMKQPFSFEIPGLSLLKPQQERILSPFFVTRSIGVMASGEFADDRMTWAAGWFNDWLDTDLSFDDNGDELAARLTGLLSASNDNLDFLHVGLSVRRVGADAGLLQLSGRPESNVADRYVDTGAFEGDYLSEIGLEIAWDRGPFLLVAEHIEARAKSIRYGDPRFSGSYLAASWVVTGESRPYIRVAGTTGAITPSSRFGALELVLRYSHLDLTHDGIDGGVLRKWHYGANWWVSPQWKFGASWGDADLDRFDSSGNTKLLLFRAQWFY